METLTEQIAEVEQAIANPDELAVVHRFVAMRRKGYTYQAIATALAAEQQCKCEACEGDATCKGRDSELFQVGDNWILCRGCIEGGLGSPDDNSEISNFAELMERLQGFVGAIDPEKKGWASLRAGVAKGQEAVEALAAA